MAFRSYFDLLSEIEELSTVGHGKMTPLECFEWRGDDEGVEGGLPSQCVSDELLSEALLGDPLLPLLDEDALQPPPPAHPQPETLMQVSLPARHPAAPGAAPAASPPRLPSPAPSGPEELNTPSVSPPTSPQPLTRPTSKVLPSNPVRVVVRTGRMVAPMNLEKSSRYLVRIPRPSPLPPAVLTRHLTLQEEEKPDPPTTTTTSPTKPSSEVPHTQTSSGSQSRSSMPDANKNTTTFRSLRSGSRTRQQRCTSSRSIPFRSLRDDTGLGAGSSRFNKRKAYELEPQKDPTMERCRQNAINARRNREIKKARMAELEKRVEEGNQERDRLLGENQELREGMARLQRQVGHLTSVLKNDSRLSAILDKVSPARVSLGDPSPILEEEQGEEIPGGVCLHLDGNEATLEFCSLCAKKASKRLR